MPLALSHDRPIIPTSITMAWRCSGRTNVELITNLQKANIINSDRVAAAMKRVDRVNYVRVPEDAYLDSPQSIGYQATISAPHMHSYACESLLSYLIKPNSRVLDVGSGSGFLSAVLWRMIEGGQSKLVGIEHIPELTEWSIQNLRNDGLGQELETEAIQMITGDGRQGYPVQGPYDAIHVGAAAPVVPQALIDQLASPGRLFIPVGPDGGTQHIYHYDKDEQGNLSQSQIMSVMYVPLTDRPRA